MTNIAVGDLTTNGEQRAMRYTPAVTIVAAWMSADTGVGPAIASGSHTNKGICADLPVAPPKSKSAIKVKVKAATVVVVADCVRKLATSPLATKLIEPNVAKIKNNPTE
jgi:hypothetical protein